MDKYSFILHHSNLTLFLERIKELGVVDITREGRAIDSRSQELLSSVQRYPATIKGLKELVDKIEEGDRSTLQERDNLLELSPSQLLKRGEALLQKRRGLNEELSLNRSWLKESIPWGVVDSKDIERIEALGYLPHFYTISEKSFKEEWNALYPIEIINRIGGRLYFVLLSKEGEEIGFNHPESKLPPHSLLYYQKRVEEIESKIAQLEEEALLLYREREAMEEELKRAKVEFDLYMAKASSVEEVEGSISILKGFAPSESRSAIEAFLEREELYYLIEEATEEDDPPVKLKNNFFSRLFEPIGKLYMLPKYGEVDLTPYFAPFYMLFFGFCLGDMGYGATILLGATVAKFFYPKFKPYLTLGQFLGFGAVLMASLTGTFFGTSLQETIPMSSSVKALFFSDIKMFWFSILFGLFQIIFAKLVRAIALFRRRGPQYALPDIGWSIVIIWAAWYYATTMQDDIVMPQFVNWIAIVGALFILLFTSDSGNIFKRLFKGGTAFYDVTGVFGDMLSYIRLFGLGTSGGILGMVVNAVAISMASIPYLGWLLALIMLLFGHTLVLLLSGLGAFVHPMRLTFVEFYKNAGFEGGGRGYKPLGELNS